MGYFDSVMQAPMLDYDEAEKRRGQLDQFIASQTAPFQNVSADNQALLQQAGFVPQAEGSNNFVTPERQLLQLQNERITALQEQMQAEAEKKMNNPLFRVGDTLADAGRLFLSPIFWLSGEDQTEYDPSERVKTGYRQRFEQLEQLRYTNAEKFLAARDTRIGNYTTMIKNMRDAGAPLSSGMKELRDFAYRTGQMELFNRGDLEGIQTLQNQMDVQKGDAIAFGVDRVLPKPLVDLINTDSKDFKRAISGYRGAYEGYQRLIEALSFEGGIADVSAVFSFMKALDPTSVVREGEFAVTANAGGLYDKLNNIMDRYSKGDLLPDAVKREMYTVATELMNSYTNSYDQLYGDYSRKAQLLNFTDGDIETFFGSRMTLPQPPERGMFLQQLGPLRSNMNDPIDLTPDLDDLVEEGLRMSTGGSQ